MEEKIVNAIGDIAVNSYLLQAVATTVAFIIGALVLRKAVSRIIKGQSQVLHKEQRRWLNHINNATILLILVALVFIWLPQIHTFALSLTAVAVAVVLTTKELLMCLTGGLLRATTRSFEVGDWITVDNATGEVIGISALSTTVQEIDFPSHGYRFTGRTVHIPNSCFLTSNVENANFMQRYLYHEIKITVQQDELDVSLPLSRLQMISEKYFAPHREGALAFNNTVEHHSTIDFDDPDPQVFLQTRDDGSFVFSVRLFVPTKEIATINTNITRDFLEFVHELRQQQLVVRQPPSSGVWRI